MLGSLRMKAPNNVSDLFVSLENSEGLMRKLLEIEVDWPREEFVTDLHGGDSVRSIGL